MLWAFGGTLELTSEPNSIKAEISGVWHPGSLLLVVFLVLGPGSELTHTSGKSAPIPLEAILAFAGLVCLGLLVSVVALSPGSTTVTLTQQELTIVRRRFGREWRTLTFSTSEVRNLGYLPRWDPPWWNSRQPSIPGVICFDSRKKTWKFGAGIEYDDAKVLIHEMNRIYKFPWDLPEGHVDY